ncbi:hypothetical protein [Thermomonas carbonis]|uniref:Uncharacterized protein n=1 Tax=Thermomonas carbonis TaxID=1463158 RepID=A0A7G9ST75_9GAMM|nr:hypothetical protein [Thermomonas carbonis]QNN71050.1 hypothetical protein H9L16_05600 [Thermomonas carbonis]GHC04175.1 hypothetical protein GCM10010080_18190 [Thermomonas carbonis]
MRSTFSSRLRRHALLGFLAIDMLGLVALVVDQVFSTDPVYPWIIAMGLVIAALPLLAQAVDYVLSTPADAAIVPDTGEKIP